MAQAGFTPIITYYSTTASAVPTAANLSPGELALNIADMKLYCENSSGVVTLLADAAAQGTVTSVGGTGSANGLTLSGTVTSSGNITLSGTSYTANNVLLGNGTSAFQVVAPGANGNVLTSNGTTWTSAAPTAAGATKAQAVMYSMIFG